MSTLKVNTIQDASGGNSLTPSNVKQGIAKVWINYSQSNGSTRDSFNVSSFTDNEDGVSTVNFSITMPNDDYCVCGSTAQGENSIADADVICFRSYTTTSVVVETFGSQASRNVETDHPLNNVVVFGD